jgi:hypothetical protein
VNDRYVNPDREDDRVQWEQTMKWADTGNSGDFEQPPIGTHKARCIGIVDLGTQHDEYQGKPRIRRVNALKWELPEEKMEDGRPFVCTKFYTASLSERSNLYADLVNWRGREFSAEELAGFDAKNVLDKTCLLSITAKVGNDGKTKNRITGIMKGGRDMQVPPRVNELQYFSLERGEFDRKVFDSLSEWYQNKIKASPEWAELHGKSVGQTAAESIDELPDDIPF